MNYKIGQVIIDNTDGSWGNLDNTNKRNIISECISTAFNINKLSKIGIQSRPGAIFAIGNEDIMIGRSGTYELHNELVKVQELYILSNDIFIIDFRG